MSVSGSCTGHKHIDTVQYLNVQSHRGYRSAASSLWEKAKAMRAELLMKDTWRADLLGPGNLCSPYKENSSNVSTTSQRTSDTQC